MQQKNKYILYEDFIIKIIDDSIIFKHYYTMFIPKVILFNDIDIIEAIETYDINIPLMLLFLLWPTIALTIFEHHITYYSSYVIASNNAKLFIIRYKNQKIRCGFTVKNPELVESILKEKIGNNFRKK